ncbi:hypothetical protein BJ508DRAFT_190868, partial [Ascobolus immersus RN42]
LLLFLLPLLTLASAATYPLFCKCTCLSQSAIIPLTPTQTCTDCTRQFCLSKNLDICDKAEDKEGEGGVATSCFQRDSGKDRVVVGGFIVLTLGLLGWGG